MRWSGVGKGITAGLFSLLTGISLTSNSVQANSGTLFFCGEHLGEPATMAQTPHRVAPVIRFISGYFEASGWTDQRRCQEVSTRFQNYYQSGKLNYLTTSRMNGESIICVAEYDNGPCISENNGLLLTLKQGVNERKALMDLLDVRDGARGPLDESSSRLYVSIAEILNKQPQASSIPRPRTGKLPPLW